MGIFDRQHNKKSGFTIVELLVVIVVIGILAGLVAVYYPNYQMRTRDSERKSDLSQLSSAFNAYALKNNTFMETASGCGFLGDGNGWVNAGPDAFFPKSISTCLIEAGVIKTAIIDPTDCVSDTGGTCGTYQSTAVKAYMKATCTKSGAKKTYLFAYLENEPRQDATIDALCDANTVAGFNTTSQKWGTNYGMNYYVVVK